MATIDDFRQRLRKAKRGLRLGVLTVKRFPTHNKVGLGIGTASLGLSIANYLNNRQRQTATSTQIDLDKKSLSALEKIHQALEAKRPKAKKA